MSVTPVRCDLFLWGAMMCHAGAAGFGLFGARWEGVQWEQRDDVTVAITITDSASLEDGSACHRLIGQNVRKARRGKKKSPL